MPQFRVRIRVIGGECHFEQLVETKNEREAVGLAWLAMSEDEMAERTLGADYRLQMMLRGRARFEVSLEPELPTIDPKADG